MKRVISLLLILLSFSAMFAEKPKLAVMNFVDETGGKLSKDLLRNGSKLIRSRFTRNAKRIYAVVTDRENEAALAAMKKESRRPDRDRSFQIELGKQVSASKIVMSTIGTLDAKTFLITSTLTDVAHGIDETSADAVFDGTAKGLIEAVDSIIRQLLEDGTNEYALAEAEEAATEKTGTEAEMEKIAAESKKAVSDRRFGGVEWSAFPVHNKNWNTAAQYCSSLNEGGYSDWRLPTIDEMRSIVVNCPDTQPSGACVISNSTGALTKHDYNKKKCSGCRKGRPRLNGSGWFWTSSGMPGTNHYWVMSFKNTRISHSNMNALANVYCVR